MSNKILNIKERILYFLDYKGITKSKFFEKIGMTYGNFTGKSKETPLNSEAISNILLEFPDLNLYWLITGEGEMTKPKGQEITIGDNNKNINNINSENIGGNITISQNDISEIIEIQREMNNIIRTSQSQLTESQKQVSHLIEILKNKQI